MFKSITWQQVAILSVALTVAGLAHWKLGQQAGAVTGLCATLIAFMLGRPNGAAALLLGLLGFGTMACSNQTPAQTATEVSAGVSIAKGVCSVVGIVTNDPIITLICPALDEKGQPVVTDAGQPKMVVVKMPRASYDAMVLRTDGGQ